MRKVIAFTLLAVLAFPTALFAQAEVVARKKAELGYSSNLTPTQLNTLLRAVASEVHGGIYVKTTGNNCLGYSCDIICFADGRGFDVLVASDTVATPAWQLIEGSLEPSRCELQVYTPPPLPPPTETPIAEALAKLSQDIATLRAEMATLQAVEADTNKEIKAHRSALQSFLSSGKMWAGLISGIVSSLIVVKTNDDK